VALFCRANDAEQCPVSGVRQPCRRNPETAEFDPIRKSGIMIHTPGTPPAGAAQSRGIPPLFKADSANLTVSASKDGKLRVVYGGWDDAKVV
jgi:hypothetical protein